MPIPDQPVAGHGWASGEMVSHYRLVEALEQCGPGELCRARDTRTGRTVAIRLLPPAATADPLARAHHLRRAVSMRELSHPNIAMVFDAGVHRARVFVAFEYHAGQSLRTATTDGRVPVSRALDWSIQIASAVSAAHAAGYIHRGLSADTIVVTAKDRVKIPSLD
ncbi:MAG: protein kinase, partial [Vicinamibacterales bacterium]